MRTKGCCALHSSPPFLLPTPTPPQKPVPSLVSIGSLHLYDDLYEFSSLPQEIQDQIWTLTLPSPRVFYVKILFNDESSHVHRYSWVLRNVSPLPTALQICYNSRAAALRQGFFFEYFPRKSLFFIPETDILSFGPGHVHLLQRKDPISIPGLDRVLNLGFGTFYFQGEDNGIMTKEEYWRKVVKYFYTHMPNLKTLNHISPMLHRRPLGERALSPLPGDVKVKHFGRHRGALYNKPWTEWKISIMNALEGSEHRPEICGWKLTPK